MIQQLPRKERTRLMERCETVPLQFGKVLGEPGIKTRHVYFPTEGFISLLTVIEREPSLEVGLVGREGMCGAHLALGVLSSPLQTLVQGSGTAQRMSAAAFREELEVSPALQGVVRRYLYVVMSQIASSAACLQSHVIGPRLARWLLMTHDRASVDTFHMTQELLAFMLGVRRVGVTLAAGAFQQQGLIHYKRGALTVVDRPGLEAAACTCYAADRAVYSRVMH